MKAGLYSLLSFLLAVSIACGSGNGDNGEGIINQEFPIPRPEGGEIITDGREDGGITGYLTLRYDAGRYDEIVEFYDDYAGGSGWNRSEAGRGSIPTINYMNLMDGLNISIGPPDDQIADALVVTLTVS